MKVYMFFDEEHAWIWCDDVRADFWRFRIPNVRRPSRRTRVLFNSVQAYQSMLLGRFEHKRVELTVAGVDADTINFAPYEFIVTDFQDMKNVKDEYAGHVTNMNAPFFSFPSMDWFADPTAVASTHVYVDASIMVKSSKGYPVACYAIHADGETQVFESNAGNSVEAEYQGILHALRVAQDIAVESGKKVTIFADCCPAITQVVLRDDPEDFPFLGQQVVIQWLPGHKGYEGMTLVDNAARNWVRENMCMTKRIGLDETFSSSPILLFTTVYIRRGHATTFRRVLKILCVILLIGRGSRRHHERKRIEN